MPKLPKPKNPSNARTSLGCLPCGWYSKAITYPIGKNLKVHQPGESKVSLTNCPKSENTANQYQTGWMSWVKKNWVKNGIKKLPPSIKKLRWYCVPIRYKLRLQNSRQI